MHNYKTFAEALTAEPRQSAKPKAANDNKQPRKEHRYRGTLPALRWLYDNHPELAEPVAAAVQALAVSNWDPEATDDYLESRPTIGEIERAAKNDDGEWLEPTIESDRDGNPYIQLGALKFIKGELAEYGETKKGGKLAPRDRARSRVDEQSKPRDASRYIFRTTTTTPSPLRAEPYQRPFSGEPALIPMYDPQKGVEANRAVLQAFGVDGSVSFENLPFHATRCRPAIAKGAEFLGGVVQMSGNSSSGAVNMGELPDAPKGDVIKIIEDIASGASLKDIGERMGFVGVRVDRMAKEAILDVARVLSASNDNKRKRKAA
ncbi:hypothetical protein FJ959_08955 [Mesorhizobium sp. B2-2-4]|uniref:hypothetical protein n=1 Tax=unclassified Mesorhizobium TaxID=325217 RepID=UPI00112659AC|nr:MULTISPECIES: hypothetical protein [unclassified Mesorhizobium]TPM58993.1 hypothetical protein FJ959_08955 [Mesorhizobium sp. B2-2-4]TPM67478.1 hypothetical protein FJ965_10095 [Mesorhizobium sp. B2-2-1]